MSKVLLAFTGLRRRTGLIDLSLMVYNVMSLCMSLYGIL